MALTTDKNTPNNDKPDEMVNISKGTLDELLGKIEQQGKELKALASTVSQTRLEEARASADEDKRPRVHFKVMDGKVVVGWASSPSTDVKSEIVFNPHTGLPIGEILKTRYYYLDGSKSELLDQILLTKTNDMAFARVVEDRGTTAILEFEDQTKYPGKHEIHKQFWNA